MAFQVHQEPLYRRYYAPWFSPATLYTLFFIFVIIILPLIIAYNTYDFWLKEHYYLEQPEVSYKYLANLEWYGEDSNGQAVTYQYSTNAYINQLFATTTTRVPIIRSAELDDNRDGKMDRLEFSALFPLLSGETIRGFSVLLWHDVKLSQRAKYLFDAVTFYSYEAGTPMQKLSFDGDLILRQSWPFSLYGGYRRLYSDDPLFDIGVGTPAQEVTMNAVMQQYNARNATLGLRRNYEYVERRGLSASSSFADISSQNYFNVSMSLRVPLQPVVYTPATSQVLKVAWIQYISFFLLVAFLLLSLNSFIYRHQLLPTYAITDVIHQKKA